MPEVRYTTTMSLPVEKVWEFVKDMNNWAPFLTGYQSHQMLSETDSVWTLKGDVGVLSRVVKLKAHVTEWNGPERVAFTLEGLNETVEGGGTLVMEPHVAQLAATPAPPKKGLLLGLFEGLFRWLMRALGKTGPKREALPAAPGEPAARLTFTLRMDAGGPTGPLVNAMLGPALLPAAEDLADKIAAHLEKTHAA